MFTAVRRLLLVGVFGGSMYAGWIVWKRRSLPPPRPAPEWSPSPAEPTTTGSAAPIWRDPVDGHCPDGYPVKVNTKSGIFHVPGGRFYDRTVPIRCYPDAPSAEADGYRAATS